MKLLKLAAGVLNQTPLDWENNRHNIVSAISIARGRSVSVLCLPELCITGYGCEDSFFSPGVQRTALEMLQSIASETTGMVVSVGLPVMYAGGLFNSACLLVDGKIAGFVAKQHLAGDGIHYEPRWFKPWPESINGTIDIGSQELPIGDLLFDIGGIRFGFEICEDAWVGTRPGASLAARGADVLLNPSASHFAFGKHRIRRRFVLEGSRAFNVTYVYANLVGNEAGRAIYDGDAMIASGGKMLAVGRRLSYAPFCVTECTVDIDSTRMNRSRTGSFEPDVDGDVTDVIEVEFGYPKCELVEPSIEQDAWEEKPDNKTEEFTRSVCLGLFDYMRKSRSNGFVLSLSGGVDSAAVAVLVSTMLRLAEQELGVTRLIESLSAGQYRWAANDINELTEQLLTTVYQKTENSSQVTQNAAKELARAVGTRHYEFDVNGLVDNYCQIVSDAIGQELSWDQHDVALQNIQARVRSPGVWMLANLRNALLLSTSNRSEAAVGYATMDGDTSGGLSPIAGIDKAFLCQWLRWMETEGPDGIGSIPQLRSVNVQTPTAELRPRDLQQTDESDLMPYEILDFIERLAVRDKRMPIEVVEHLKIKFRNFPIAALGQWTIRFFRLWCRNQWKRERYAPSFHLDDENLDPKTWCRFPILSGGYEYEIKRLEEYLELAAKDASQLPAINADTEPSPAER